MGVTADITDEVSTFIEIDSWDTWGNDFRSDYFTGVDSRGDGDDDVQLYQAYVEVKSRTSSFEVRTGEYETQILSVYLTLRRYWGFSEPAELWQIHEELADLADEIAVQEEISGELVAVDQLAPADSLP